MADETIEIKPVVDVQPSIAELKKLQKELKATTDPAEFKRLQQQIDDTKEAIAAARAGAGNFAEVLGELPGPIGQIGGQVGGLVGTLKQFGQIKIGDIKGSFVELGKDLVDAGKGLANLTGLTKVYTIVNNALAKSFFGVAAGETAAATAATVLTAALAATGITLIIGAIALLVDAYDDWANGAEKAAQKQKELNEQLQKGAEAGTAAALKFSKTSEDLDVKRAQAAGKTEAQIQAIRESYAKDRIRITKEGLKNLQKIEGVDTTAAADAASDAQDELTKIQLDGQIARRNKSIANSAQNAAALKRELDELKKARLDARNSLLDDQTKEIAIVNQKYDKLIALAKKNRQNTKDFEDAAAKEIGVINKKYADQRTEQEKKDAEALEAFNRKVQDIRIAAIKDDTQQAIVARENKLKTDVKDLEADANFIKLSLEQQAEIRKNLEQKSNDDVAKIKLDAKLKQDAIEKGQYDSTYARLVTGAANDLQLQRTLLEQKKANDDKYYADLLANENLTTEQIREINDRKLADQIFYTDKSNEIERNRIGVRQKALDDIISIAGAESDVGKAALIAKQILSAKELILEIKRTITFSTQAAARSTVAVAEGTAQTAKVGFPQNIPLLIGYAAQAFGIISAIRGALSAAKSSTAGISGGGSFASVSGPPPIYGGAPASLSVPQIQSGQGVNPTTQIASTLSQVTNKPVQAYVVSSQISSQQALDRRTNVASTFN
jgi:hypothetical protein